MIEFNPNDSIDSKQIRCVNCGYELAKARAPIRCPQCGVIYQHSAWVGKISLGERLALLNVVAVLLAFQTSFPPRHWGFGWFPFGGAGPGLFGICIVIPLQVIVAFWALFSYVSHDANTKVGRFYWLGAVGPFVMTAVSVLAVMLR